MSNSQEKQSQSTIEAVTPIAEEGIKSLVPGGGVIVQVAQALTQRGEYSFDHKSMPTYIQFISEDLDQISKNVQKLLELADRKKPDVADIAATLEAIGEVSRTTTNYKKRELLRHAAINAFDPEFYEEGLVRRFLGSIKQLEYGDVEMFRKIVSRSEKAETSTSLEVKKLGLTEGPGPKLDDHHFAQIVENGLVVSYSLEWCSPTEYGKRFLKFVSDPEPEAGDE